MQRILRGVSMLLLASAPSSSALAADDARVRLVLQVTVDGLRADLLTRNADELPDGGFRYLLEHGAVFANAHYQHANTETIVGHATLATGAHPSVHGMTGNVWYDAEVDELSYNIEDPDHPLLQVREEQRTGEQVDPAQRLARTRIRTIDRTSSTSAALGGRFRIGSALPTTSCSTRRSSQARWVIGCWLALPRR